MVSAESKAEEMKNACEAPGCPVQHALKQGCCSDCWEALKSKALDEVGKHVHWVMETCGHQVCTLTQSGCGEGGCNICVGIAKEAASRRENEEEQASIGRDLARLEDPEFMCGIQSNSLKAALQKWISQQKEPKKQKNKDTNKDRKKKQQKKKKKKRKAKEEEDSDDT